MKIVNSEKIMSSERSSKKKKKKANGLLGYFKLLM